MKGIVTLALGFTFLFSLPSCQPTEQRGELGHVGMLIPDTIGDEVWNSEGYKGLLEIRSEFDVEVFYEEGIKSESQIRQALDKFADEGVTLVFGHGNIYAPTFSKLKTDYPEIHFVTFNADVAEEDVTSIHFEGGAMGFFGGVIAAEMSDNDYVGVIAAYPWQPEVKGFVEGAKRKKPNIQVEVDYVNDWGDQEKAKEIFADFARDGVDIFYPAGDGFNVPLIQEIKQEGLYAIGYVSDQLYLGKETILTSTVQEVESVYIRIAEQYNEGTLEKGNVYFDFDSGVITMGEFSPVVEESFIQEIEKAIEVYVDTGDLPQNP